MARMVVRCYRFLAEQVWKNWEMDFQCTVCGERHELPLSYSVKVPMAVAGIAAEELEQRVVWTPEQCVIDGRDFYLRGRIAVPIDGLDEPFIWGVWAEVSPKNFMRTNDLWEVAGREQEADFPGWLQTEIPLYGDTVNLEVQVRTQVVGRRPHFEVVDEQHPLAVEQRQGILIERVEEIAELMLHGLTHPDG